MATFYFIFGISATAEAEEGEWKEAAKLIAKGDGALTYIESGDHPANILGEFDGWGAFLPIEEEEYREIKEFIKKYKEKEEKELDVILLVSSSFGVYIPQAFIELYPEKFTGEEGQLLKDILLSDPNSTENYQDAWAEVLDFVTITDELGTQYYLHHEEDLWAVPVGYDFEDFIE